LTASQFDVEVMSSKVSFSETILLASLAINLLNRVQKRVPILCSIIIQIFTQI